MTTLRFTVPGRPVSLNSAYSARFGGGLVLSTEAKDYKRRVAYVAACTIGSSRCPFKGNVLLVVTAHFGREADAGAVAKFCQDALQGIAYSNDSAVLLAANWKGEPDPRCPRTEILLREVTDEEFVSGFIAVPVPASWIAPERTPPKRTGKAKPVPSVRHFLP